MLLLTSGAWLTMFGRYTYVKFKFYFFVLSLPFVLSLLIVHRTWRYRGAVASVLLRPLNRVPRIIVQRFFAQATTYVFSRLALWWLTHST